MSEIFVVSDTHLNHANILKFTGKDGKLIRPGFESVSHMNEVMIERWNKVVRPQDKIYHLGDVYFGSQSDAEKILSRLNGKKRLIVGNHDCIYGKGNPLQKHFQKIYMWRIFREFGVVLSHVPIHEDSFRKVDLNVHGHTHEKGSPKGPYRSVCVEMIDYRPINIEEVRTR